MYAFGTWLREPWIPPIQGLERGSSLIAPSGAYVDGLRAKKDSPSAGPFLLPKFRAVG